MENKYTIIEIGTGYTSIPAKIGAATEIVVEELSKSASKSGHHVVVFDIKDKNRPENNLNINEVYVPGFMANYVEYKLGIFHKLKRIIYSISLSLSLIRFIKKNQLYILHFHNQFNFFFFYLISSKNKKKNLKLYYTNHTPTWSRPWNEIEHLISKKYFLESYSLKNADQVYVLNEITSKNLITHLKLSPSKIKLIPNGVNTEVYKKLAPEDIDLNLLRKKLNLIGRKAIFHAGAVCERKNQLEIIEYLTPVFKKDPGIVFLFAGGIREMEYFNAINEYCSSQNIESNVIYLGELPPGKILNDYYNLAIAFIFFSKSEGFSLALLEALSAGLPVILSRNLEIDFTKEKDSGILFFENQQNFYDVFFNEVYPADRQVYHSGKATRFIGMNYSWDRIAQLYFN